jgi:TRAP-type transport system periplasmic protein
MHQIRRHLLSSRSPEVCINQYYQVSLFFFDTVRLGNPPETLDQVRSGALEFLTSSYGMLSGVTPEAGLPTLGFIFDGYDKLWTAIDGDLGIYINGEIEKPGDIVVLPGVHDVGFRQITSNKGFFLTPGELKGLRVRTPPSPYLTTLFKSLGASPTPIGWGDLYTSLQTGTVDGQENPLTLIDSAKLYEVQRFCTLTSHSWDGWVPIANRAAWNRLPPDIQKVVEKQFRNAAILQRGDLASQTAAVRASLEKKGLRFQAPLPGVYRNVLRATSFYANWKSKMGAQAWAVLERNVGRLV